MLPGLFACLTISPVNSFLLQAAEIIFDPCSSDVQSSFATENDFPVVAINIKPTRLSLYVKRT
jgi:hypothetical protein